jgi:hypothetical protein
MRRTACLLALLIAAGAAGAQTMYRCGSTYSQAPCGPDAQQIGARPKAAPNPAPVSAAAGPKKVLDTIPEDPVKAEAMRAQCREWITRVPAWKDRDSVKVGEIKRAGLAMREVAGREQRVRAYATVVNAKNGFGGYGGERLAICWTDDAETTMLDLYLPGM